MRHKKSTSQPQLPRRRPDPARRGGAHPRAEGSAHRHGHDQCGGGHARLRPRQGVLLAAGRRPGRVRGRLERGGRLPAQRPVQAPADPHRADAALPVRPHDRACRRAVRADPARRRRHRPRNEVRARGVRLERRALHGVLLLDKPVGLSSNDALQKAKRLFRAEKAGHTGTLDPLASGLLPLCFGAATKFSQVSLDADKRYTATLQARPAPRAPATPKARCCASAPVAVDRARDRRRLCRASPARSSRCRRCTRR